MNQVQALVFATLGDYKVSEVVEFLTRMNERLTQRLAKWMGTGNMHGTHLTRLEVEEIILCEFGEFLCTLAPWRQQRNNQQV